MWTCASLFYLHLFTCPWQASAPYGSRTAKWISPQRAWERFCAQPVNYLSIQGRCWLVAGRQQRKWNPVGSSDLCPLPPAVTVPADTIAPQWKFNQEIDPDEERLLSSSPPRWPAYQLINIKQNFKHVWMKVLAYWRVVRRAGFRLDTHQM